MVVVLQISKKQEFEEKGYYTWIYEGPQAISNLMTFLIIAGFLAITCFPIWPHFLKVTAIRGRHSTAHSTKKRC